MATNPNRQLAKLAVGLVSVAALAGITGRLSASTGPARESNSDNGSADSIQAAPAQDRSEHLRSFGSSEQGDDDSEEEDQHSQPTFAQPGSDNFSAPQRGGSQLPRRRTRHS